MQLVPPVNYVKIDADNTESEKYAMKDYSAQKYANKDADAQNYAQR